ncbi:hypothetical protein [Microbacterium sp. SD291]|uniref:hypothetical protein n=1 Tax=Microbacterium sp. SD291 TaxID=2782007 RepID=UPI001A963DD4|nr:hypothetical protein [Microbacterium sp. SD291]MBO0981550.1 hypothetical protein [Microbacterium sp. SD291]
MNRRRQTLWVSIGGVVAMALYAGLGLLQLLVLTPLAAAPGRSLDEIRAELSAAGESLNDVVPVVFLSVGVLIALVGAVVAVRARAHPAIPAMVFLSLLMLGAPVLFHMSFLPGMALADTYMIGGGVMLRGMLPFYAVSAFAGVLLLAGVVVASIRTRAATRAQEASAAASVTY